MADNPKITKDTEARIYASARAAFRESGFAGARMQQIADNVGINKALLHYYFRSKERLYQLVFAEAYDRFSRILAKLDDPTLTLAEKIGQFVVGIWQLAAEDADLLLFISAEIAHSQPGVVGQRFQYGTLHFTQQLREGIKLGLIKPVEPLAVVVQLFSLCIYPLESTKLLPNLLQIDEGIYKETLRGYYEQIPNLILTAIRLN